MWPRRSRKLSVRSSGSALPRVRGRLSHYRLCSLRGPEASGSRAGMGAKPEYAGSGGGDGAVAKGLGETFKDFEGIAQR